MQLFPQKYELITFGCPIDEKSGSHFFMIENHPYRAGLFW